MVPFKRDLQIIRIKYQSSRKSFFAGALFYKLGIKLPTAVSTTTVTAATVTTSRSTPPLTTTGSTPAIAATGPSTAEAATCVTGFGPRAGFVDRQIAALEFFAIQAGNRCLSFTLLGHLDEGKAARFSCEFIFDDCHRCHFAKFFECLPDILIRNGEWQIPHIYIHRSPLFFCSSGLLYALRQAA
jgi:hypothetical protein